MSEENLVKVETTLAKLSVDALNKNRINQPLALSEKVRNRKV